MANTDYRETDQDELAKLPLSRLNAEIARCLMGYETGGSSQGRKAFFQRLVLLERVRDQAHNIPAKHRSFSSR